MSSRGDETDGSDEAPWPAAQPRPWRTHYGSRGRYAAPIRVFVSLLVLLFCIGMATIVAADYLFLKRSPGWFDAAINAGLMTLIGSGIVWYLFMRPLRVAYMGEATRARAVLDAAVEGIVSINERGVIESFNPAAEQMFHFQAREVIGKNVGIFMPEPDAGQHNAYLDRYLTSDHARLVGNRRAASHMRKDGSTFPIEISLTEIRGRQEAQFHRLHPRHHRAQAGRGARPPSRAFRRRSPTFRTGCSSTTGWLNRSTLAAALSRCQRCCSIRSKMTSSHRGRRRTL